MYSIPTTIYPTAPSQVNLQFVHKNFEQWIAKNVCNNYQHWYPELIKIFNRSNKFKSRVVNILWAILRRVTRFIYCKSSKCVCNTNSKTYFNSSQAGSVSYQFTLTNDKWLHSSKEDFVPGNSYYYYHHSSPEGFLFCYFALANARWFYWSRNISWRERV